MGLQTKVRQKYVVTVVSTAKRQSKGTLLSLFGARVTAARGAPNGRAFAAVGPQRPHELCGYNSSLRHTLLARLELLLDKFTWSPLLGNNLVHQPAYGWWQWICSVGNFFVCVLDHFVAPLKEEISHFCGCP